MPRAASSSRDWHLGEVPDALQRAAAAPVRLLPAARQAGRSEPLDPVARFHLGNGAALERLNWLGDTSETGMARSAGLMVNYVYWLNEVERNHERYFREHRIAASRAVEKLARECRARRARREAREPHDASSRPPAAALAENVMHFARLLRARRPAHRPRPRDRLRAGARARRRAHSRCGARTGTGPCRRCCSRAQEQRPIFDQAFRIFWRDPKLAEKMMQLLLPQGLRPRRQARAAAEPAADRRAVQPEEEAEQERRSRRSSSRRGSPSPRAKCCSAWTSTPCRRPSWPRRRRCCASCACRCR